LHPENSGFSPEIRRGFPARILLSILTIVLVVACSCLSAFADSVPVPLKLNRETEKFDLKGHVALYEDKTAKETINVVREKTFRSVPEAAPSLGYSQSVYWVKLVLENETPGLVTVDLQIANQYLDFVDFYVTSNQSSHIEKHRSGARVPWDKRVSQGRYPILRLDFSPDEEKTIFIRVQSRTPIRVPLDLLTEGAHQRGELVEYLINGFFFGALGFLIVYSLFAWSILRQRAYLYYILTIAGVAINQLGFSGLAPRAQILSQPETILHLFTSGMALTFVFNIVFVCSFMDARAKYPILYRVLDFFLVLAVLNAVLYVVNFYVGNRFAQIYGPALAWILPIVIGLMWYWGESHARYLFLAHVQFPVIAFVHVGVMVGFVPYNFVLTQMLKIAYLFQGMFFALALADRYSMMQRNFQHMLEDQVAERTDELVMANESLHREVNERKRVEKAIEKAKREWEQTFDTVPDLIAIIDQNHKILRINRAMAEKLNIHPRDAIGLNCHEVCHGTDEAVPGCPLRQSLKDGNEHSAEIFENRLGGTFLVSVTPLRNGNQGAKMFVHVARDITERKAFEERLSKLALTDSLTNIWNRRHFMYLAGHELERARRYGGALAIMMIDLDHFKAVNDAYGHEVGDRALKKVAEVVSAVLRKVDIFARIGGEEFVIALPETGLEQAVHVAERLRGNLAGTPIANGGPPLNLTVSIGITVTGQSSSDLTTLLKQADTALYNAKRNGRNRVEVFLQQSST